MKPSIGLLGANGAGKTTIADYLVAEHGYRKLSFAEPLRELARINVTWKHQEEDYGYALAKEHVTGFRQYLIDLGEGIRKYDPVYFVKALAQQITDMDPARPWVVDDVRKQVEVNFLNDMGFRFVHLLRGEDLPEDAGLVLPTQPRILRTDATLWMTKTHVHNLLRAAEWALGTPKEGSPVATPDPKEEKDGSTPVHEQPSAEESGGGSPDGGEGEDAPHWCARCEREWEHDRILRTSANRKARARWYSNESRRHRDEGGRLGDVAEVRDEQGDTVCGHPSRRSRVVINPSHWPGDVRPHRQ